MRRLVRSRGFTLVELAVVVVIVGVLAVIGLVGYSKYRASARMTEATNMTTGIRGAQEAYKAERGVYASVSNDVSSFYPATAPGKFVTAWGGACATCVSADAWKRINVTPHGPVMFGYATVAGVGAALGGAGKPTGSGGDIATPSAAAVTALGTTSPFYVTVAWGDSDADGHPAIVVSYSVSNQIFVQQE
jgi:type IV pilus assembly protein PilA